MDIQLEINQLLHYGLENHLIEEDDFYYCANRLLALLKLNDFKEIPIKTDYKFQEVLNRLIFYAYQQGIIEGNSIIYRDLFDSQLMDCLMPRPNEVNSRFWLNYKLSPQIATDYYYHLSKSANYIRIDRSAKNLEWQTNTQYGKLDITINLSKPEKDPQSIALATNIPKLNYPKCLLCRENEGYRGHINHPGRSNHRIIKLHLTNEIWFLQYSPYVYYNEHCIVFNSIHVPMKISRQTFEKLLDFVKQFPHYFIGSNADLPIVGGSILTHDHFQGGRHLFPMMHQGYKEKFTIKGYEDVEMGILDWPLSVVRLRSMNISSLIELSDHILTKWKSYLDIEANIIPYSNNESHNTITPIARFVDNQYEMNLVLRNNITTVMHPLGLFHPHEEHHHIKKENIGLIEVMGLAVLPPRLKREMELMKTYLLTEQKVSTDDFMKHLSWLNLIKDKYKLITEENVDTIIQDEIGEKFVQILTQCGVFKMQNHFIKFIECL